MEYRIDTHMHTTASDGTLNPEELLNKINEKQINRPLRFAKVFEVNIDIVNL